MESAFAPQDSASQPPGKRPRLLFVVNTDWFFLSHRLPLARAASAAGAEVMVAVPDTGMADVIRGEGFQVIPLPLSRKGTNPFAELGALVRLVQLYRRVRPDLLHHITIKPVLYGSLAARLIGDVRVVNTISGLGYAFSARRRAAVLRPFIRTLYRIALRYPGSRTIFQNADDRELFLSRGLVPESKAVLVRGSGVCCSRFQPSPERGGDPLVVLPGRMLWDKGIGDFVEAARRVRAHVPGARFALVGTPDEGNPSSVPVDQLEAWASEGVIEWWGHRSDMPAVLSQSTVVVLASTDREGLPKVLLEAAASGRAVVATDVPGCREIVRPGVNGLLVPPRDPAALTDALLQLLRAPELRAEFGQAGRRMVVEEFSEEIVVTRTIGVYRNLLGNRWPDTTQSDALAGAGASD